MKFGEYFKARRLALPMGLREFCVKYRLDPGNISRLERGVLAPPQDREILTRYARCLGLVKGGLEWQEFFDLAALEQGRIPPDVMNDEQVVAKLPVIFRAMRDHLLTDEKLNELVELIRRS